jgi:copper chaperone
MNYVLKVDNLKCDGCGNTISKALSKIGGIQGVVVDAASKTVVFDANDEGLAIAKERLHSLGYPVTGTSHGIDRVAAIVKSYGSCAIGRVSH